MDRDDGLIRQRKTRIEFTNRLHVPFGDLAEIDVRKHRSGQTKLSWADPSTFTTGTTPPTTIGNCVSPAAASSSGRNGASDAPKSTVLLLICRMPTPDPTAR